MTTPGRLAAFGLALSLSLAAMAAPGAAAEELYSDRGFFIDLPEGFSFADGDGVSRFSFVSPDEAVRVDIVVFDASRFPSAKAAAEQTARNVSGRLSPSLFRYAGRDAALGEISFGSGAEACRGLAFFLDQAPAKGKPAAGAAATGAAAAAPYDLVILAYGPAASYANYKDVIASAVDGFSADSGHRTCPGPVGAQARAALGAAEATSATIAFGKARLATAWDRREAEIEQDLVEREYRVLMPYGAYPELAEAAMARFYRMVYRDAAPALDRLALSLSAAWETGAWSGKSPGSVLPPAGAADSAPGTGTPRFGTSAAPRAYAEALLSWVQGFGYERDEEGSDVVAPLFCAMEARGDCDSRALLLALLLRRDNIESILMISLEHEHALLAVDAPGSGARFPFDGRKWLVAETTAQVGIGLIDSGQSDMGDWFGIDFPF